MQDAGRPTSHVSNSEPFVGVSHTAAPEETKRHSQESRNGRLRQAFGRPAHEPPLLLETVSRTGGVRLRLDNKAIQKVDTTLKTEPC